MHACDATYNNAGVQRPAVEMADASGEEFDRVTAINLRGIWNCMKYELRQMRETRSPARIAARHGSRSSFGQSGLAQRVRASGAPPLTARIRRRHTKVALSAVQAHRGTKGSNPFPSSGESVANSIWAKAACR